MDLNLSTYMKKLRAYALRHPCGITSAANKVTEVVPERIVRAPRGGVNRCYSNFNSILI
jgi:hypothetical protein